MNIREKILVIEDEKSIAHFISTVLNSNGYEAMQARTGSEAMSMISSHCPDLIILDLGLPDMDGLEILRQLRSWSSVPVVVVSARSHERIDYNKHQVLVRGENVHLTLSEFRIVALLGKYAGKVLTYDFIIKELWGPRASGDNQILRVNMANIRRKIEKNPAEPEYLFTEVGVGYRMAEGE